MPQDVLLVEDSPDCRLIVERALTSAEVRVTTRTTVRDAVDLIEARRAQPFDLVILDLGLPDGDGLSVLEKLRAVTEGAGIPVFVLTGNEEIGAKLNAFRLDADEYLVKPINPVELRARAERTLRRVATREGATNALARGSVELDLMLMKAYVQEGDRRQELDLTGKEFKILAILAKHQGQVLAREELVKTIWGEGIHVLARTVDSHVCSLRKKMGTAARHIESVPGVGYRFVAAGRAPR